MTIIKTKEVPRPIAAQMQQCQCVTAVNVPSLCQSQFSPALSAIDSRPVSTGHRRSLCAFVPQRVAVCESREQCQQVKERAVNVPSSDSLSSHLRCQRAPREQCQRSSLCQSSRKQCHRVDLCRTNVNVRSFLGAFVPHNIACVRSSVRLCFCPAQRSVCAQRRCQMRVSPSRALSV